MRQGIGVTASRAHASILQLFPPHQVLLLPLRHLRHHQRETLHNAGRHEALIPRLAERRRLSRHLPQCGRTSSCCCGEHFRSVAGWRAVGRRVFAGLGEGFSRLLWAWRTRMVCRTLALQRLFPRRARPLRDRRPGRMHGACAAVLAYRASHAAIAPTRQHAENKDHRPWARRNGVKGRAQPHRLLPRWPAQIKYSHHRQRRCRLCCCRRLLPLRSSLPPSSNS